MNKHSFDAIGISVRRGKKWYELPRERAEVNPPLRLAPLGYAEHSLSVMVPGSGLTERVLIWLRHEKTGGQTTEYEFIVREEDKASGG